MKNLLIGIDGGSSSGKSTLARMIRDKFGATLLPRDNYYRRQDDIPPEERKNVNYDHPEAFDNELFVEHLCSLKNGKDISSPVYDYETHNRSSESIHIIPSEIIVVDGIMLLQNEGLRNCFDFKVFVDCDEQTRLARRIARDTVERGRKVEDIKKQFYTTVQPMHELYIEPFRNEADMIIASGDYEKVIEKIKELIKMQA